MTHIIKKLTRCAAFALVTVGLSATLASAQTLQRDALKFPAAPITLKVDEFAPVRAGLTGVDLPLSVLKVVAILPGSSLWGSVPPALRSPLVLLGTYDR